VALLALSRFLLKSAIPQSIRCERLRDTSRNSAGSMWPQKGLNLCIQGKKPAGDLIIQRAALTVGVMSAGS